MATSVSGTVARWTGQPARSAAITSAAFTPANNSLLVCCVTWDEATSQAAHVVSGGSLQWDQRIIRNLSNSAQNGGAAIWTAPVGTGASMTVAVTRESDGDNLAQRYSAKVYVVTGQHASPIGNVNSGTHSGTQSNNASLTASGQGRMFACATDWSQTGAPTSTDGTEDSADYSTEVSVTSVYKDAEHTSGTVNTNITYGSSSVGANWAALEILAAADAGSVEATPGAGALTAAGPAPTKLVNWARAPGVGAVTAAGYDPSFIERSTRYAYPSADIDAGPWTPSTGAVLYAMIDEAVADDNDYIVTNTAGTAKITLKPVADPGSSAGHVVNYRIWSPVGGNATVRLVQGASTVIASWDHTGLPTTATNYSQPLSGAEADSITDYDDLHIEFEAT